MAVDYATLKKADLCARNKKNNFSLRLAVVGGNLTAENLQIIAKVAEKYGDGHVHLTSRQSVEIPFIKLDDVEEVKEVLATGGCKPGCVHRVSVRLQPVRERRYALVEILTVMILQKTG